jgi:hypothetical protein
MSPRHRSTADHHIGVFPSRVAAEAAVRALVEAGFRAGDIGLFVHVPTHLDPTGTGDDQLDEAIERSGETGAAVGALAGGLGGVLAGFGLLAIPGVGPVLAVGPLAGAFTGAVTGGAAGGFAGSLVGLGISEAQARAAEGHLRAGRTLVVVQSRERRPEAAKMLADLGAIDVGREKGSTSDE